LKNSDRAKDTLSYCLSVIRSHFGTKERALYPIRWNIGGSYTELGMAKITGHSTW